MRLSMTDFSGFLKTDEKGSETQGLDGLCIIADDSDGSSYMSLDADASAPFPRVSPDEVDPYGWEAELNKKLGSADNCCPVVTIQYRRAGGTKRTLLQRVLSLGPREVVRKGGVS